MHSSLVRSVPLFLVAALLEIGGGYLIWLWLREGRSFVLGIVGALLLATYGIAATYQPADFGRVYAAYGGLFIAMSLLWAWGIDKRRPDMPDVAGAVICLIGAAVILYWPRRS